ncbi:MAG: hypothetical protein AMXMBFR13_04980 [Phycisphaerae bacterium]
MSRFVTLASIALVVTALYVGEAVLMPLALGILLSFLLAPLVTRLERVGIGRISSVIVVTFFSFAILGATTYFVARQLVELAGRLPEYRQNIRARVDAFRSPGTLKRAADSIQEISKDLATTQPTTTAAVSSAPLPGMPMVLQPEGPLPVSVVEPDPSPFDLLWSTVGSVIGPLGVAAIVVVFVIFMLIQREDLRDRLIYLLGRGHIHLTTQALDDASRRISRYLLMQLFINASYGIPVAIGLYLFGLPNALVWGLLATLLRYLPYIGPWIAAVMPITLAFAISSDWWLPLEVIGLFIVLELISNNVLEPWLYGSSTGMSSVAVIVSAVFWTWLWGPVGLLLATPLTVCLVVAGKYVPQLAFLNVLLGDEPIWDTGSRFYQRLLAMDDEEASELAEEFTQEHSLLETYDRVVLPALHMAERDRHYDRLDAERDQFIKQSIEEILEDLETQQAQAAEHESANGDSAPSMSSGEDGRQPASQASRVLCIPAHDESDAFVAGLFARVLRREGYWTDTVSANSLVSEILDQVDTSRAQAVCISALPPAAVARSRYLCKRLRTRFKQLKIVVALWNARGNLEHTQQRLGCTGSDKVVTSFSEGVQQIGKLNLITAESLSTPVSSPTAISRSDA